MRINPSLVATAGPPIPAARRWADRYAGALGPLIDMAQAVPGSPPPPELLRRLGEAGADSASSRYGAITGDEPLLGALARDIDGLYGASVGTDELAITAGCNQAFFVTALALAAPGDEIILPAPWYFNHKMTLDMLGVVARALPCRAERGFVPDPEDARALIGPRTRAIVLVTPNNPTGAVYPAPVLKAFQALAAEHGLALVVDETYRDFLPDGQDRPHDLLLTPEWRQTTIQLYSFSKSYAIPGHRLGSILAAAPVIEEIGKVLDSLQICAPRVGQIAVGWAIEGIRPWREEVRREINRRAALFRTIVEAEPGWSVSAMGAYFSYVRHPFTGGSEAAAARLAETAGLLTLPGGFFGPGQDSHLRFAFANVPEAELLALPDRFEALRP